MLAKGFVFFLGLSSLATRKAWVVEGAGSRGADAAYFCTQAYSAKASTEAVSKHVCNVSMYVCLYVCVYIYIYIFMHACMHIYIHTYIQCHKDAGLKYKPLTLKTPEPNMIPNQALKHTKA